VHRRAKNPGYIYISNGRKYPERRLYAFIDNAGEGNIQRTAPTTVKKAIRKIAAAPISEAVATGIKVSQCCFCGISLINSISVHHGYGPICAEKYGLPWTGSEEQTKAAKQKEVELIDIDSLGMEEARLDEEE
jgi:hypothetical protein